jgi:hypothetical protein
MNFSFSNSISFDQNGCITIQNGSQTIKMGQGGMVIENGGQQQIVMNNNGIQFFQQQTYYPNQGHNFQIQTNFSNNQYNHPNQSYEEELSEEMSSHNSSYEDHQNNWHNNYQYQQQFHPAQQMPNNGYFQHPNFNVGWQINHQVNFNPPNVYYGMPQNVQAHMPQQQAQPQSQPQPQKRGLTKSELNSLPVTVYSVKPKPKLVRPSLKSKILDKKQTKTPPPKEETLEESCAICAVDYKFGDKFRTLPCIHKFHKECVDKWLVRKSDCPICRYDLLE